MTILSDVMEVDDTGMIQCTVERDDGSIIVMTFCDRDQLIRFIQEDAVYGCDYTIDTGRPAIAGNRAML
jgi:hypothetical protein